MQGEYSVDGSPEGFPNESEDTLSGAEESPPTPPFVEEEATRGSEFQQWTATSQKRNGL